MCVGTEITLAMLLHILILTSHVFVGHSQPRTRTLINILADNRSQARDFRTICNPVISEMEEQVKRSITEEGYSNFTNMENETQSNSSKTYNEYSSIDSPNIDPNSKLDKLLESFVDILDSKEYRPDGIHPELNRNSIAGTMDTTLLTEEQKIFFGLESQILGSDNSASTKSVNQGWSYWKYAIIPYRFSKTKPFDRNSVNVIISAMDLWRETTCIKWVLYTDKLAPSLGHNDFVEIQNGRGCYSHVGQVHKGAQTMSLQAPAASLSVLLPMRWDIL